MVVSSNFSLTGWKAQAINNWQLASLIHIQDGAPFTVTSRMTTHSQILAMTARMLSIQYGVYTHKQITQASKGGNQ